MLFSILFLGFSKTAIMNSTHTFTNFENLSSLYVLPQTNPIINDNPTNNLAVKKLNKKKKSRRTRRDAYLQTSKKECKKIRVKDIKPNDSRPFECVCIKLLKDLCSKIINKINDDLPRTSLKQKEAKLSRDTFLDYVKKFSNNQTTNNSSNVIDYNYFLADKLWFSIYLLSNKKFYSEDSKTLEDLQKKLIYNIEIQTNINLENKIVSIFNIDNYRNVIKLIQTSFQVNDKDPCGLGNSIDEHLRSLDNDTSFKMPKLKTESKDEKKISDSTFKIVSIVLGIISFVSLLLNIFNFVKCMKTKTNDASDSVSYHVLVPNENSQQDEVSKPPIEA